MQDTTRQEPAAPRMNAPQDTPQNMPHAQDAPAAPRRRSIYDLYAQSARAADPAEAEFPDAAELSEFSDISEALGYAAPDPVSKSGETAETGSEAGDPNEPYIQDASEDESESEAETPEILSRVDSLLLRHRSPPASAQPQTPASAPALAPAQESAAFDGPAEPDAERPAGSQADDSPIEQLSAEAPDADDPPLLLDMTARPESPDEPSPPEKTHVDDDDLPVLTDMVLAGAVSDAPVSEATPAPIDAPDEDATADTIAGALHDEAGESADAAREARIAAEAAQIAQRAAQALADDISRDISRAYGERLARELPALLAPLLDAARQELRAALPALVEEALREAASWHRSDR